MSVDRCVVCGKYVPEGRQVCYECEWSAVNRNRKMTREEIKEVLIRHRNAFANDHGWAISVLEALDTAIGVFAEPKEMTAGEFIGIWNRLCKSYNTSPCEKCPVHEWCMGPPRIAEYEEMETVLVEWATEHPEMNEIEGTEYLWISLLMAIFAKPGVIINPEKVKANIDNIKQIIKESNIDFYSISLKEIEAKSQEVYDLIEEYIT